jgi:WD40 repeat protein
VFVQCLNKIDVRSLYDNTEQKDKTRFGKLPTKLEKTNRPVTFNKQIKSSGYGSAPNSIKYSQKEKQKQAQKLAEPVYEVARDFFGKPFPMLIPAEVSVLNST